MKTKEKLAIITQVFQELTDHADEETQKIYWNNSEEFPGFSLLEDHFKENTGVSWGALTTLVGNYLERTDNGEHVHFLYVCKDNAEVSFERPVADEDEMELFEKVPDVPLYIGYD